MSKREGELKSALFALLKDAEPRYYVLHHSTAGAADWSISGDGRTTLWEFKHGTPHFDSLGNQVLMCRRLARATYCRYVIWEERGQIERTLIVHPDRIADGSRTPESWCMGFDHAWLLQEIVRAHVLYT